MKTLSEAKATLLHKSATREAYDAMEAEFSVVHALIAARIHAGLTQSEVAQRMGTTQSVIARMESGRALPLLRTLTRYAQAVGYSASVKLTPIAS